MEAYTEDYMPPKAQDDEMDQTENFQFWSPVFRRRFAPETDCWQFSIALCLLHEVNENPNFRELNRKAHREYKGKRRADFAVLCPATDPLGIFPSVVMAVHMLMLH